MRCEDEERKTERILYFEILIWGLIFDFMEINCQAPRLLANEHLFFPRTHPGIRPHPQNNFISADTLLKISQVIF